MTDKEQIEQARSASNKAIVLKNAEGVVGFYTDDIIVISGEGGKHSGRKSLLKIWKQMFEQDITLFERNFEEIIIGDGGKLAWEKGIWRYLDGAKGECKLNCVSFIVYDLAPAGARSYTMKNL